MATPMFRFDPVELPPEALQMRAEVREFIKENQQLMEFPRRRFQPRVQPERWASAAGSG